MTGSVPVADLRCDSCGRYAGAYPSYEEWEDAAKALGWTVGEDLVLCGDCSGARGSGTE